MREVRRYFRVSEVRSTADRHVLVEFFEKSGKGTPERCLPESPVRMQLGEIVA